MKISMVVDYGDCWLDINKEFPEVLSAAIDIASYVYRNDFNCLVNAVIRPDADKYHEAFGVFEGLACVENVKVGNIVVGTVPDLSVIFFEAKGMMSTPSFVVGLFSVMEKIGGELLIIPVFKMMGVSLGRQKLYMEWIFEDLELLSPKSIKVDFAIAMVSADYKESSPEVYSLVYDEYDDLLTRCIEFPPEYHRAGVGILNGFAAYLRDRCPGEKYKVKIEQEDLLVRLVVENENGEKEVVEEALHEFGLIVTGAEKPESFTDNQALILELKSELRIAQVRVEDQRDIIGVQNTRIDELLSIVGEGLTKTSNVTIDFKPSISASNSVHINHDVSSARGLLNELREDVSSSDVQSQLSSLEESLVSIESEENPAAVRASGSMSKLKRFLDKAVDSGSELNATLSKAESGMEILKDLAGKYNNIAQWCGLSVIPESLLK